MSSLLPFPIATVNGNFIAVSKFITRYNIGQKITDKPTKKEINDQLIDEENIFLVSQSKRVEVSQNQINLEYDERSAIADFEGKKSFEDLLKSYGLTPGVYKSEIIRPELLFINLQNWFYAQKNLNTDLYKQADALVEKIQKGDNIGMLAQLNSQQDSDKKTNGDLGFVNTTDLLPELREVADNLKVGEIKIIPSRFGLHIFKLEGKRDNLLHLRQIFLTDSGFQSWYNNEIKNYKVRQLINI